MTDAAPAIVLDRISVAYGDTPVVRDISLEVTEGEMHVLLGESGSGKTTILRAIAGFEAVRAGRVEIAGAVVDRGDMPAAFCPPERRRVGVVFQYYALFPHLDVAGNVAFAMRGQGERRAIAERCAALLERVGLGDLGARQVSELSGGQQQRVALARALAQRPRVMLLDEPFSNLNRELRIELRERTTALLRDEAVTAVFVTHDRDEAFAIADRISVIHGGAVLQTGSPAEIYEMPVSEAAARSVGAVNLLAAEVIGDGNSARCGLGVVSLRRPARAGQQVRIMMRPERLQVIAAPEKTPSPVSANRVTYLGSFDEICVTLADGTRILARALPNQIRVGQRVVIRVDGAAVSPDDAQDPDQPLLAGEDSQFWHIH
ncbi:MAG: ABC transporter ATP-binding protein [Myxococcota bacterium]